MTVDRDSELYKTIKKMMSDINKQQAKNLKKDIVTRTTIEEMVNSSIERRLDVAMVRVNRKDAFYRVEGAWKMLNHHLIKIVMWGDSPMWRKEIKAFAEQIDDVRLKLKSRTRLTKSEHLDAMTDYRNTPIGRKQFFRAYDLLQSDFNKKPSRDLEEGRKIVYELQMAFLDDFIKNEAISSDTTLNSVLNKYSRLEYRP